MEGTQYFVIEENYVTSSVLKVVWYLRFRDLTSLTFDILLPEHPKAPFLLGLKFWEQEAELECSAMFSFGVSLATKVGSSFPSKCMLLLSWLYCPFTSYLPHMQSSIVFLPLLSERSLPRPLRLSF